MKTVARSIRRSKHHFSLSYILKFILIFLPNAELNSITMQRHAPLWLGPTLTRRRSEASKKLMGRAPRTAALGPWLFPRVEFTMDSSTPAATQPHLRHSRTSNHIKRNTMEITTQYPPYLHRARLFLPLPL